MKRFYMLTVLISLMVVSQAQITVESTDFLPMNSVILTASDTSGTVFPGDAGENITWDFSGLMAHNTDLIKTIPVNEAPDHELFPDANYVFNIVHDSNYVFLSHTGDNLKMLGLVMNKVDVVIPHVVYHPFEILLDYPINYGDVLPQQSFWSEVVIKNPIISNDSIKLKTTIIKDERVDAWGTLVTPLGTFQTLRICEHKIQIDSIWFHLLNSWVFYDQATDSSLSYSWFTNSQEYGFVLLSIGMDLETGETTDVTWFKDAHADAVNEYLVLEALTYPNPAKHRINLVFGGEQTGIFSVFDLSGKEVLSKKVEHCNRMGLDIMRWPSGIYFYRLVPDGGTMVFQGKFIKN